MNVEIKRKKIKATKEQYRKIKNGDTLIVDIGDSQQPPEWTTRGPSANHSGQWFWIGDNPATNNLIDLHPSKGFIKSPAQEGDSVEVAAKGELGFDIKIGQVDLVKNTRGIFQFSITYSS